MYFHNKHETKVPLGSTATDQSLKHVVFCHLDSSNCSPSGNVYWSSGYYRNLRIWDGDRTNFWITTQYSQYYPTSMSTRTVGILAHYPFTLEYITKNTLSDPINSSNDLDMSGLYSWNFDNIQQYNFSSGIDYIENQHPAGGKFVSGVTNRAATIVNCPTGCSRCYSTAIKDCYECKTGYYLVQGNCYQASSVGHYFYRSPSDTPMDLNLKAFSGVSPTGTVTFWMKVLGFSNPSIDMILYSSNLKLTYDSTNFGSNSNFGLNLVYYTGASNTYVVNVPDFKDQLGQWKFFSLAYYYDSSTSAYFPAMLKFEIDSNSYALKLSSINSYLINSFTVKKELFALITMVKAYDTYIIGAFGFETNQAFSSPVPVKTYLEYGSNTSDCLNASSEANAFTDTYLCVADYSDSFSNVHLCNDDGQYFAPVFTGTATCETCPVNPIDGGIGCSTACMNGDIQNSNSQLVTCSCTFANDHSSMILSNSDKNICYRFDYLNFAKVSPITLTGVQTAKSTKTYAMQFWVFAYDYVSGKFNGVSLAWNYHNKITIEIISGSYYFVCYPMYDSSDSSFETTSEKIAYSSREWNYISCSVDLNSKNVYLHTETATTSNAFGSSYPPGLDSASSSSLVINDRATLGEWGVLFLRQIRLWQEPFLNRGFLSRV